jgi:YebC/PmpR family DNA-binding regulatory protein
MPKDKVEAAIKRAQGKEMESFEEILYECYGPHGAPILIETATDNPTRTVANIRAILNRGSGNLGSSGSVAFQFQKMGVFRLSPAGLDQDELELDLIDHGLEEMGESETESGEPVLVARCAFESFGPMQKALEDRGITPISAEVEWIPSTTTSLADEHAEEVLKLVDKLEQDEDVQKVFHNLA